MNKHPHVVTISGVVYTITITVWLYATTICIVIPTVSYCQRVFIE